MEDDALTRVRSLPAQIIRAGASVVLKRGCTEIRFQGGNYADRLDLLLRTARSGSTERDILAQVDEPEREEIRALLRLLRSKHFLISMAEGELVPTAPESPLDIFNWHFEPEGRAIRQRLQSRRIVILGQSSLSQLLSDALRDSGFRHVTNVSYPNSALPSQATGGGVETDHAHNGSFAVPYQTWIQSAGWGSVDCIVAASNVGGRAVLRDWNDVAMRHHRHFLPVVLQNAIGFIGPLAVPGETACYECLVARENSHLDEPELRRAVEQAASEGRDVVGYHPLMNSVLAGVAAFELVKFYSEMIAGLNVGTLIEVDLLGPRITTHKVLRVPRCMVCSSLHERPSVSIHKPHSAPEASRP